jgi:integrase/recombinase XerD
MGSTPSPGPALVAAAADADPVTLLVLGWLAAKRSANTRTAYARDIGITPQRRASRAPSWLAWCQEQRVHPVTGVTVLHVARYARQLDAAGLSPASAARKLAAVSGWYAWLARRGHITASPAAGIARPRAVPHTPPTPALTRDQALALVHAADTAPGPQRVRTAALVAVLLFTGARVSEVIGADVGDLGAERGHRVLQVTRANGRRQGLTLPGPAASRIDAYLAERAGLTGIPPLFATRTGERLFAADVWRVVRRLATRAGLPADLTSRLGPRVMRHSFAALYLDVGGSLRDLQSAMGHADPRTTRRYDQAHTQPQEPPPQHQPACQARVPGSGPWPRGRPHCRARRPLRAVPRPGGGWPAHEVVGKHRPPAHLVVFVFVVQRPPAVPRCHGQALGSLVLPEPGPPAFPVQSVSLLPIPLQVSCAGRLGDAVQGDGTTAPPARASLGQPVLGEHPERRGYCRRRQPR